MSKGVQIASARRSSRCCSAGTRCRRPRGRRVFAYYQTLDEFRAGGRRAGQPARVHGYVALGSIERDVAAQQVRFAVQEPAAARGRQRRAARCPVIFASLETPDLFKDGAEVVVEGRLRGRRGAPSTPTSVLAKCPSKFEGQASAASARAEQLTPSRRAPVSELGFYALRLALLVALRGHRRRRLRGRRAPRPDWTRVARARGAASCFALVTVGDRRRCSYCFATLRLPARLRRRALRAQHGAALPARRALGRPGRARCCSGSGCSCAYSAAAVLVPPRAQRAR